MLAEEANLGKTRFLAAAGHDILQPLNAARLYCSSLIEKAGRGRTGDAARNIESSLESVETILGAVLDISRLDAGAMKPAETVFRLDGLLRQIGTDFQPLARGEEARADHRAVVAHRADRPQPAAPADPEPRLQRHQVHADRPHPGRRAPARRARRNPGVRHRHRHSRRQAEHRLPASSPGSTRARARRRASASACRSSTASRACCGSNCRSIPGAARARASRVILPVTDGLASAPPEAEPHADPLAGRGADRPARCCASTTTRASSTACGCCWRAGAARCDRSLRLASRWPTPAASSAPDIILADYHLDGETGLDADRARCARVCGELVPAVLVTADRSTEVRAGGRARSTSR